MTARGTGVGRKEDPGVRIEECPWADEDDVCDPHCAVCDGRNVVWVYWRTTGVPEARWATERLTDEEYAEWARRPR